MSVATPSEVNPSDNHQGACQPDEDEFLELVRVPFDELVEQVMKCGVADGKTVAAVLKAKTLLGR